MSKDNDKGLTLFAIGEDMERLKEHIEMLGGDVSDPAVEAAIDDWLLSNQAELAKKLEGYGWLIRQETGIGSVRKAEADRMASLAKVSINLADRLKRRLAEFFKTHDLKTIQTDNFKFNLQGSGGVRGLETAKVVQEDPRAPPERYVKMVPMIDTDLLRADLESTDEAEDAVTRREALEGLAWLNPLGKHLVIR